MKDINQTGPVGRLAHTPGAQGDNNLLGVRGVTRLGSQPTVRLAIANGQAERGENSPLLNSPTGRLATPLKSQTGANSADHLAAQIPKDPTLQLALSGAHTKDKQPALLVSYVYLDPFLKNKHRYAYRDWVMDSGAFSAHKSGTPIQLSAYIDCCKKLLAEDPTLTEVFSLDVIGNWRETMKNVEAMWKAGVPAIPCFHVGSPWDVLKGIAKDYPKIALGGAVGYKGKDHWAAQCFARVWPKKIHGFGFGGKKSIMALPFHSVDATNWEMGPCAFGRWNSFGKMSVRGSKQNLRVEVEWYLRLEQRARDRWKKEMALLENRERESPVIRLAQVQTGREEKKFRPQ